MTREEGEGPPGGELHLHVPHGAGGPGPQGLAPHHQLIQLLQPGHQGTIGKGQINFFYTIVPKLGILKFLICTPPAASRCGSAQLLLVVVRQTCLGGNNQATPTLALAWIVARL